MDASMDADLPDGSNGKEEKRLVAIPVAGGSSGEGLPYAPEDWPRPGDIWRWKVGNRKCVSGHWVDRCVSAPPTCPKFGGKRPVFHSKSSLEEYIRKEYPQTDVEEFFSSFIWRVPYADMGHITPRKGTGNDRYAHLSFRNLGTISELVINPDDCKAGNMLCNARAKEKNNTLAVKDCDICCSEAGFCRDCCCILCCKTVDWSHEGCSFIRCEASLDDHYICGHMAHLECALRSYLAGTVGGSIGLDVEYYCRRCDNKTDLFPHVSKLVKVCESIDSREDMEKILNLGYCILRGSEQKRAKSLQNHITQVIMKLERGVHLDEIWKVGDNITPSAGDGHEVSGAVDMTNDSNYINEIEPLEKIEATDGTDKNLVYITSDYSSVSAKLEDQVDQALRELKKSQESEYMIAEQKLYVQKNFLLSLYRQLEYERSELANPSPSPIGGNYDALLSNVVERVDQIKNEEDKLKKMMKVGHGFGSTPKSIVEDHFGLVINE
ncbi:hypothetical protein Cni_G00268 [Canna indica]|uniref:Oberon PHD finger domain-containing protein n=1 Tax=Canna indica TaxID=4628 RepID=A0AAQ3JMF5_9LILI|nr:hypothetical protein Cni_G00268 [Canna indica]